MKNNIRAHPCPSVVSILYKFPESAKFGRVVSKSKIYKHAVPNTRVKELFVREVEKIIWAYKLSPATINLPASDGVQEIQVFTIILRTGTLSHEVLKTIDKAIPSPILFVLNYNGKTRYAASYKRPGEADKNKWVVSGYFGTKEFTEYTEKHLRELPLVLSMGALYETILKELIPLNARDSESLQELVERVNQLCIKEREAARLVSGIKKEKQFNRKVELNRSLNKMKCEIDSLKNE